MWKVCGFRTIKSLMTKTELLLYTSLWLKTHKKQYFSLCLQLTRVKLPLIPVNTTLIRCMVSQKYMGLLQQFVEVVQKAESFSSTFIHCNIILKKNQLTYLCMIWCLSCGSSSMLTDRSEMETAAEAVSVTSSTKTPPPSSRGRSSLCVCSLLRSDRSMVDLNKQSYRAWLLCIVIARFLTNIYFSQSFWYLLRIFAFSVGTGLTNINKLKILHTQELCVPDKSNCRKLSQR